MFAGALCPILVGKAVFQAYFVCKGGKGSLGCGWVLRDERNRRSGHKIL